MDVQLLLWAEEVVEIVNRLPPVQRERARRLVLEALEAVPAVREARWLRRMREPSFCLFFREWSGWQGLAVPKSRRRG